MSELTDEEINEQIEAAYESLRMVVEKLGKKGASPLTLGVALIGVAVEIAARVGGRKDGETLIREIVEDRLTAHTDIEETARTRRRTRSPLAGDGRGSMKPNAGSS